MKKYLYIASALTALFWTGGCGKESAPPLAVPNGNRHDEHDHGHGKGIVAIGDYHARLLVEKGGELKLFILGKDETKVAMIEMQDVTGYLKAEGDAENVPVKLVADPQHGDAQGKTSQFKGSVPEALRGKPLVASFNLTIAGERYRPEFHTGAKDKDHDGHDKMPAPSTAGGSDDERDHYLKPGGIYTAADISANGGKLPSEKFKGIRWKHPKAVKGDKVCPVTNNKSDERCSWVVNGKQYEFCCPPCLEKFIDWAKNEPEQIKEPATYIKQ